MPYKTSRLHNYLCVSPQHAKHRYPQPINHSMILKTFDSKIDKWTSKIGIFGKSFNEIGTAIYNACKSYIDNIDNFDEDVSFWESLKNNLFSQKVDKAWIKNSIGEIISKENIDSYINDLDLDSAKEKLQGIFDWQEDVNNNDKTWQDYFDTCKGGNEYLIDLIKNTDDLSKLTSEDLVKANQAARESALSHNEALKSQTLSAKAGTAIFKAFAIAGNMAIMFVTTKLISSFVNFIDNLHTTLKEQQEITQNLQGELSEIQSDISDVNSELQTTSDRIDELNKKDSLSFIEKEELENLTAQNDELERRNRLQTTNICTILFICKYRNKGIPASIPLFVYLLHLPMEFCETH